jgi:hypothetical protein
MFYNLKKLSFLLLLASVFSCSFTQASEPERVEILEAAATFPSGEGYFILSDQSCWKVIGFSTRWRTITEWWNGTQLVPQNFENVPKDWTLGSYVEIYSKYGNLSINEADASNQDKLRQCTHLIVNPGTGMVLFAIPLSTSQCMVSLFNEAHATGYSEGYSIGYSVGCDNQYNSAYNNGYSRGFEDGSAVCD